MEQRNLITYQVFKQANRDLFTDKHNHITNILEQLNYNIVKKLYVGDSCFKKHALEAIKEIPYESDERFIVYGRINTTGNRQGNYECLVFQKDITLHGKGYNPNAVFRNNDKQVKIKKRELAKQLEDSILNIHSQGFTTTSKDQLKKISVDQLTAALIHVKEAENILKIK